MLSIGVLALGIGLLVKVRQAPDEVVVAPTPARAVAPQVQLAAPTIIVPVDAAVAPVAEVAVDAAVPPDAGLSPAEQMNNAVDQVTHRGRNFNKLHVGKRHRAGSAAP